MAARKGSGERAATEAQERKDTRAQAREKAKKARAEGGVPAVVPPEESRRDVLVVAGEDRRTGAEVDEKADAFVFDVTAKAAEVDHFSVASSAQALLLEIDGKYFTFDVQQALALRRIVQAGTVALNH